MVHGNFSSSYHYEPLYKRMLDELYTSKEELALDPVTVAPMVNTQKSKNYKFMEAILDLTIYISTYQRWRV